MACEGLHYDVAFDAGAREGATRATLQGSIEGLTPEEALEVVVPSAGLSYRVVDGRVIIGAP